MLGKATGNFSGDGMVLTLTNGRIGIFTPLTNNLPSMQMPSKCAFVGAISAESPKINQQLWPT